MSDKVWYSKCSFLLFDHLQLNEISLSSLNLCLNSKGSDTAGLTRRCSDCKKSYKSCDCKVRDC